MGSIPVGVTKNNERSKKLLLFILSKILKKGIEKEEQNNVQWTLFPTRVDSRRGHQNKEEVEKATSFFLIY